MNSMMLTRLKRTDSDQSTILAIGNSPENDAERRAGTVSRPVGPSLFRKKLVGENVEEVFD
jgi:hypothetical protein